MAIVNRDVDVSQQKTTLVAQVKTVNTGVTMPVAAIPFPCTLQAVRVAAIGVSGSPNWDFLVSRFIAGSGNTVFSIGISNLVVVALGTSGLQGHSGLAATGSTLLSLAANDILMINSTGANTNVTDAAVSLVVKKTQDIVSHFGASS